MGRSRGPCSVATYAIATVFLCVLLSARAESTGKHLGNEIHGRQHTARHLLQQDSTLTDGAVAPSPEEADAPSEEIDFDRDVEGPPVPAPEVDEIGDEEDTPAPAPEVDVVGDEEDTPAPAPEVDVVGDEEDTPAPAPEVDELGDEEDTPAPAPEVDVVGDEEDTPAPAPEVDEIGDEEDTPAPAPEVDVVGDEEDGPAPAPEVDEVGDEEDTPAPAPEVDVVGDEEDGPAPAPEVDVVGDEEDDPAPAPEVDLVTPGPEEEVDDIDPPAANPPEVDDDIVAPAMAPAVITTRTVELEFNDLDFDEVNGDIEQRMELESRVISELAISAGVDESDIEIVDFRRGSVIVAAEITFPEEADPDSFLDTLRAEPGSTLGEQFVTDFGEPVVTVDGEGPVVTAASIDALPPVLESEDESSESPGPESPEGIPPQESEAAGPAVSDIDFPAPGPEVEDDQGLPPLDEFDDDGPAPGPADDDDGLAPGPADDDDGLAPGPAEDDDGPALGPLDEDSPAPGPDSDDESGPVPLDFEPSPAPGSMGPISEPEIITVQLTFDDLELDDLPPTFEESLIAQLAQGAGVDESDVELELTSGSVIATAAIRVPEDQDSEDTTGFVNKVTDDPGAVLGETFTENFGIPTVEVKSIPDRVQQAINEEMVDDGDDDGEVSILPPANSSSQSSQMVGSLIVGAFMACLML